MNDRNILRILIIPPLLALAAFCAYGLLATFEPGDFLAWRIGYSVAIALCFAGIVATWLLTAKKKP
jgi:uncharacterized membrane protein (DUF485 family)